MDIINFLNSTLTGPAMVWGTLAVGLFLTFKTGFIQLFHIPTVLKNTIGTLFKKQDKQSNGISPFQAVTTALSGTLGTGNIVGVAAAVTIGGAGAVFWMWISAFFGMATKYSEIVLAVKYRKNDKINKGGPMYYLQKATGGKKTALIFAFFCVLSSFGIGNITQSNTAVMSLNSFCSGEDNIKVIISAIITAIVGFAILGGIKRIAKITELLVPFMTLFYIGSCIIILVNNIELAKSAICLIVKSAFSLKSTLGGICGYTLTNAIKVGFTRGVFTNEAGLGSAPIAHAASNAKSPAKQGMWGIFEVFTDTILMCTLTAVVIIMGNQSLVKGADGAEITLNAFGLFLGDFSAVLIGFSTAFFAVATIIGWSYYGEQAVLFLAENVLPKHSKTALNAYKLVYVAVAFVGGLMSFEKVFILADLFNSLMMIPNLIGIAMLSDDVKKETKKVFIKRKI